MGSRVMFAVALVKVFIDGGLVVLGLFNSDRSMAALFLGYAIADAAAAAML